MSYSPFVPLRVFSAYTMLEGAIDPKEIGKHAKFRGFPAAAITDRNGLYASMAFADGCDGEGVQPIIGTMLTIIRPDKEGNAAPVYDWIALYAQNETGYDNLCKLVSAAHLDRPIEQDAHVELSFLDGNTEGLIALTAGAEGAMTRLLAEEQVDAAETYLDALEQYFPDRLYIELSRRNERTEMAAEEGLIKLAYDRNLPLVATNPCCFAEPSFYDAHDAMLCIASSSYVESDDRKKSSTELWMKPTSEMQKAFSDIPEAIANTLVVAQRCAVTAPKRPPILPSLAGDTEGESKQLYADSKAGLDARLTKIDGLSDEERQTYYDRLDFEIDVIKKMGFPGYFLIVADFIQWAKEQDIPVGPGRGSGAGSVVAWALTITDLDPLKLGLLFERFLNPERISMPDFDIDFCETRRGEVIRYVQKKYGSDHVAQIITFGKLKARAVLRDTGRVLQMPYGQIDRLTKLVPNHPTDPWDLKRALSGIPELAQEYAQDESVKKLFDLAVNLEGFPRHSSTHAAGVVIGDRPLAELVPLYRDPRSDMPVTQFDMKYVETAGLVKFDFLGLKTLSVLRKAVSMLQKRGVEIDLDTLDWDDKEVYELLQRGDTVGVFQLESEGMRRTLSLVKPSNFGDIIALVSLYRPGPMDNIPSFGNRKNGREEIAYPHPLLENVLKETYGIIVYQEQVMQAAQVIAGYSLGEADMLRRAMGKKIQSEMNIQRKRFVEGAAENDLNAKEANELFDLIDKFAGYGFNKSHAAAYALLAYQTAWLKTHHPYEFYAASMCFDMHQTDKLSIFVDDMRRLDITCLPPSVNHSEAEYCVEETDSGLAVRYALAGLKNVGEKAMQTLVDEREDSGVFTSLDDLANRVNPSLLNKRQLESLSSAGGFDELEDSRARVYKASEMILAVANEAHGARASGQGGLFGGDETNAQSIRFSDDPPWTKGEKLKYEKEAFGFYFSSHPIAQYKAVTGAHGAQSYEAICQSGPIAEGVRKPSVMAALIESVRWRETKRGKRFVLADLSDSSGQFSVSCFEENACVQLEELAKASECALLNVELDMREGDETPRVSIRSARPLEGISISTRMTLEIDVKSAAGFEKLADLLRGREKGRSEIIAQCSISDDRKARLRLGQEFQIDAEMTEVIENMEDIANVRVSAAMKPELKIVR